MITLTHHVLDQQNILHYGRRVGYCGTRPNMPICFLVDKQCRLEPAEKTEVIAYVISQLGAVKKTKQTEAYWPDEPRQRELPDIGSDPGSG